MSLINPTLLSNSAYPQIDNAHAEFIRLVNLMHSANSSEFIHLFNELYTHTEQHFNEENALMEQSKFPATTEHQAEHNRVLGQLNQFKTRVAKGSITFAKAYINETLPDWFKLHLITMDSALIVHLTKLNHDAS